LVFGARIAEHVATHLPDFQEPADDESEPRTLLDPAIRIPLELAMSEGAGVMRSAKSLKATLSTLQQLGTRQINEPGVDAWEASNLYFLATAIVRSAISRTESRGSHWRSDFPETDPGWSKRIVQHLDKSGTWTETFIEVDNE